MSRAALLGAPLFAAMMPAASGAVLVSVSSAGGWTGGAWSGKDPAATTTNVKTAALTGFASGTLVIRSAKHIDLNIGWNSLASGLSSAAVAAITGAGSTLPVAASQWAYSFPSPGFPLPAAPGGAPGSPPQYSGFRVIAASGTTHYWVQIQVEAAGVYILGYGSLPASAAASGSSASGASQSTSGTPEPATSGLALLALGAAGIMRHRRSRAS